MAWIFWALIDSCAVFFDGATQLICCRLCWRLRGHARSHQTKYNPLFSKHSSGHQLIPQFPGFAEQSP
ncbi:hypothetical protein, partial [Pseudomonas putida]|uniref:hypothetical protein n=1 Tax=Pseudomonas putida TaxID=303 RepID=UPI002B2565FC